MARASTEVCHFAIHGPLLLYWAQTEPGDVLQQGHSRGPCHLLDDQPKDPKWSAQPRWKTAKPTATMMCGQSSETARSRGWEFPRRASEGPREKFVHELLGRDESTVLQQRSEEETFLFAPQRSLGRFPHLGEHGVRHLAMAAEKGPGWRLGQRPLLHVRMEVMKWAAASISSSTTKAMDR